MEENVPHRSVEGFFEYHLLVGTVVRAAVNEGARKPAYHLVIDFGPAGLKESSAQITDHYQPEDLVGRQVIGVMDFPPRRIASVKSEVLVLGAVNEGGDVVLLRPDMPVPNGTPIA
ncbi:tRNA-binding protein [Sulfobacillus harzensis]|uniref:tRNA-binding protein n=1 Tax=Sulfobacillus harzensis TaxID=2729629 RepID=A0A7Y0L1W8_9FIRM|nr:tRNA-binding protein [Sulfobacillus harzensis]NMP21771.1 tRNA-binding protein [Sulfobacillus harzensis]